MKNEYCTRLTRHPYAHRCLSAITIFFLTLVLPSVSSAQCLIPAKDSVLCNHPLAQLDEPPSEFWPDTASACQIKLIEYLGEGIDSIYEKCDPTQPLSFSIVRTYRATLQDNSVEMVNDTTCVYSINFEVGELVCPMGVDSIDCAAADTSAIYQPNKRAPLYVYRGDTIELTTDIGTECKVAVAIKDNRWDLCGGTSYIERTWIIKHLACPADTVCVDTLIVIDTTGAAIDFDPSAYNNVAHDFNGVMVTAPTDTIGTGHDCSGVGNLPRPTVTDACSEESEISVTISSPTAGFVSISYYLHEPKSLLVSNISPGKHLVIYKAHDACHQVSIDTAVIVVADQTPAVAVCHDEVNLTLTNVNDFTLMKAGSMDAESYDNCYLYQVLARRTDWVTACGMDTSTMAGENPSSIREFYDGFAEWVVNDGVICQEAYEYGFTEQVPFCCADAGEEIMVEILVIDQHCNVDRCWGLVNVENKLAPRVMEALPDDSISCMAYVDHYRTAVETENLTALNDLFGGYVSSEDLQMEWTLQDTECDGSEVERSYVDGLLSGGCGGVIEESVTPPALGCSGGFVKRQWEAIVEGDTGPKRVVIATQKIYITQCEIDKESIVLETPEVEFIQCEITYGLDGNTTFETEGPDLSSITNDCRQLGVGFFDKVYEVVEGQGCKKILRTWCVMDWCDPSLDDASDWRQIASLPGVVTFPQKIFVNDTIPPTISGLQMNQRNQTVNCTAELEVSIEIEDNFSCGATAEWSLQSMSGDIVTTGVGTTAVASDLLPGDYFLRFVATDACGNETSELTTFSVASEAQPAVVAYSMLTAQLSPMDTDGDNVPDQGMAELWAKEYNSSSAPPCGGDESNLVYLLRVDDGTVDPIAPALDQTSLVLDCSDKVGDGIVLLQFWVVDTVTQTSDYAYVFVDLDDNSGICNSSTPASSIRGIVVTEASQQVANVKVTAESEQNKESVLSHLDGSFAVAVPKDEPVRLIPEKNSDHSNGISTLDLVKIQKHILGIRALDSPYQLIAADANRDKKINPIDIIQLRRLIIGTEQELPNNTSWRFVDAAYQFVDHTAAHQEEFPEFVQLNGNELIKIVGIKVGDLDGNVETSRARSGDELRARLKTVNADLSTGVQTIRLTLDRSVLGIQYALNVDPEYIRLLDVSSDARSFSKSNYTLVEDELRLSWSDVEQSSSTISFDLEIEVLQSAELDDVIRLSDHNMGSEAIVDDRSLPIALEFIEQASFAVLQVRPNPFSQVTSIDFEQAQSGDVSLVIYDAAGRVLKHVTQEFTAGKHSIEISGEELPIGVLSYTISAAFGTQSGRLIKVE